MIWYLQGHTILITFPKKFECLLFNKHLETIKYFNSFKIIFVIYYNVFIKSLAFQDSVIIYLIQPDMLSDTFFCIVL